ncbi:MAG: cation:dicarboxylase symporter family transporter, partial [Alphaproteobacteria bacterium]
FMLKSASWLTVALLIAGVIVGTMVGMWGSPQVKSVTETFESVGVLWLNALRMTVIPLVFCLLVTGIASVADAAATGRLAVRAIVVFAVLLVVATTYACIVIPAVLEIWPVDPVAAVNFVAGAGAAPVAAASPPTIGEWLAALAPSNPISAAAEGAVLPLTVFAIFFGFAATRLPTAQREPMVGFFRAVADTMITIVRWVLVAAPIGVFALSLGVGLRSGIGAAGVLLQYIVIACSVTFGVAIMAFLFAVIWGRFGAGRFLNASAPVLAVAFSTQSSLASLPIMVERSTGVLGVPAPVANLVLPLAVAVFRMTSPVTNLVVVFFVAAVHGMHLDVGTIISGGIVAIAISVGSVGLPGQVSFIASVGPICLAMGVPIDVLGILLAVEVIPDIFRTVGNVMGDMAATVIANRSGGPPPVDSAKAG